MSFDLGIIVANTISGTILNLPWFILIYAGFYLIAREIREFTKKIPFWLQQYFKLQNEQTRLIWAKEGMRRL